MGSSDGPRIPVFDFHTEGDTVCITERILPRDAEVEIRTGTIPLGTGLTVARETGEDVVLWALLLHLLIVPLHVIEDTLDLEIPGPHLVERFRKFEAGVVWISFLELTGIQDNTVCVVTVETSEYMGVDKDLHPHGVA